jgi:hypothetical protein
MSPLISGRSCALSCILSCRDNILPQPIFVTLRFRYDDNTQIRSLRIFPWNFFGSDLARFPGYRFLGDAPIGPLPRPRRVLGDLTTVRAAGDELGRCDVERRTPSATAAEIIKHTVALTLATLLRRRRGRAENPTDLPSILNSSRH